MFYIDKEAKTGSRAATAMVGGSGGGARIELAAFEPFATSGIFTTPSDALTRVEIHLRLAGREDEPTLALSETLSNTVGLMPRHMRRATDLLPAAAPKPSDTAADEPAPLWYLAEVVLGVDRSTPELRSRIGQAKPGFKAKAGFEAKAGFKAKAGLKPVARLPPQLAWPMLVGTCLGIGDLVLGW
jgi:hypothetical protein